MNHPDFEKNAQLLLEYIYSQEKNLSYPLIYEDFLTQFQKEILPNHSNQFAGFWWNINPQIKDYWIMKIKNSWHDQDIYHYLKTLFGNQEIDMSFKYGLMGLLLWLSKENKKNSDFTINSFLQEATRLVLSKKMKLNANWNQYSFLPESFDEDTWTSENMLSWNFGDLHIVKLLYQLGINKTNNFAEIAENIGLFSIGRISEEKNKITDSSLQNGSIGLVILYNDLYQKTNQKAYMDASLFWLKKTEIFLIKELQTGYYKGRESNILDGLAGILVILKELQKEDSSLILTYLTY
jgi:hypothetical protein